MVVACGSHEADVSGGPTNAVAADLSGGKCHFGDSLWERFVMRCFCLEGEAVLSLFDPVQCSALWAWRGAGGLKPTLRRVCLVLGGLGGGRALLSGRSDLF